MRQYYKVLGVDENATKEEIKRAYKQLSVLYHPDKHNQDPVKKAEVEIKQKEINEAYSILGDQGKRLIYDETGSTETLDKADKLANNIVKEVFKQILKLSFEKESLFGLAQDSIAMIIQDMVQKKADLENRIFVMENKIAFLRSIIEDKIEDSMDHLSRAVNEEITDMETAIKKTGIDALDYDIFVNEKALRIIQTYYPREEVLQQLNFGREFRGESDFLSVIKSFKIKNPWTT